MIDKDQGEASIKELVRITEEENTNPLGGKSGFVPTLKSEIALEKAKRLARTAITHATIERATDKELASIAKRVRKDVDAIQAVLGSFVSEYEQLRAKLDNAPSALRVMDARDLMRIFGPTHNSGEILRHILKMLDVLAAWFNYDKGAHAENIAPYRAKAADVIRELEQHLRDRTFPEEGQNSVLSDASFETMGNEKLFGFAKKALGVLYKRHGDIDVQASVEKVLRRIAGELDINE